MPYDYWGEDKLVERLTSCELVFNVAYVWDEDSAICQSSTPTPLKWCAKSGLEPFLEQLPQSHRHHRSLKLQPYKGCTLAKTTQAGLIAELSYDPRDIRCELFHFAADHSTVMTLLPSPALTPHFA